jgi:branched-chain amino acid transport system substrate-binding protein
MITRRHAVASLSALGAGALAGCGPNVPDTIKIGVVVALSGPSGPRGNDLLRGAQLAAQELNQMPFKIGGKVVNVEIVSADDKGESEATKAATQQVLDSGVVALIGTMITPHTEAIIPVVAQASKPHLFTATGAHLHSVGKGNTFRLVANDYTQGLALASFIRDNLRAQRLAVVYESVDPGKGLNATLVEALAKANTKIAISIPLETKAEITADVGRKLKDAAVDTIAFFSRDVHLKQLFKSLQDASFTDVTVVASNAVRNRTTISNPIPVKAMYATATAIDAKEFVNGGRFLSAFEVAYKQPPVWGAHYSYDAVYAVAGAAASIESVDGAKLIERLRTKEPRTRVNDHMRWGPDGELKYASIAVYQADRGAWQLQMRSSQW